MALILVVDDEPLNRELLRAYLEGPDHEIIEAENGAKALELAASSHPDIVLLDVLMPGIDGFETVRRLKEWSRHEYLPVVLITALNDTTSRLLGLRSGADEFLTKPVERQELTVRVHNLLSLRAKDQALLQQNIQHAELHRLKDELSSLIVHDIKNPLSALTANLQYVLGQPHTLDQDLLEALEDAATAARRALDLTGNLLEVARMEGSRLNLRRTSNRLSEIIADALRPRMMSARLREISLDYDISADVLVQVDRDLMIRVLENLVDNGLRYAASGGRVEVWSHEIANPVRKQVELRIGNTGSPIPPNIRDHVFDKFTRGEASSSLNQGLGLYFCRLAVEAHGGRIWIEETNELPTVFAIELERNGAH